MVLLLALIRNRLITFQAWLQQRAKATQNYFFKQSGESFLSQFGRRMKRLQHFCSLYKTSPPQAVPDWDTFSREVNLDFLKSKSGADQRKSCRRSLATLVKFWTFEITEARTWTMSHDSASWRSSNVNIMLA